MSTLKDLKKLENKRALLLLKLQKTEYMIRGTYVETYRKCGKQNCRCAKENKGHPGHQISWTKDGKSRSKAIPKEDILWIKEMAGNYKKWRGIRTNLRKLEEEARSIINWVEDGIIQKTENLRKYF